MAKYKRPKAKMKPNYTLGGDLKQYGGAVGNFAAGALNTAFPADSYGVRNDGLAVGEGALQGAGAGAAFGPIGAGVGALVGGITGFIGNDHAKARKEAAELQQRATTNRMLLNNQSVKMASGGKLETLRSNARGGSLKRISPDAMEVEASGQGTDTVDVGPAYVDNKEIVDYTGRVFSDDRGFASRAKKLEKMKSKSSRFGDANKFIDAKLDRLFQEQESSKQTMSKGGRIGKRKFANGGSYFEEDPDPSKPGSTSPRSHLDVALMKNYPGRALDELDTHMVPVQPGIPDTPAMAALRKGYRPSTNVESQLPLNGKQPMPQVASTDVNKMILDKTGFRKGGKIKGAYANGTPDIDDPMATATSATTATIPKDNSINWGKGFTQLATFGPNIINAGLANQLPPAPVPTLEPRVNFERVNANDQLTANSRQSINAGKQIRQSTGQAGNIASNLGSVLSRRLSADNEVRGSVNRQNSQIQMNEAYLNNMTGARNVERINAQKMQNVQRKNAQISSLSSNLSNVGEKALMQGRESNMMDRDLLDLDVMKKAYQGSGVYNRNFEGLMSEYIKRKKIGNSKGGRIRFYDKLWKLG